MQHVRYIVQFWVGNGYDFWQDVVERSENMFSIPRVGRETEDEGRAQLLALREAHPDATYQLIRETTTVEVLI